MATILHDFGILEIDEAVAFALLGDGGEVRVAFGEVVEIDVLGVVGHLFHGGGDCKYVG